MAVTNAYRALLCAGLLVVPLLADWGFVQAPTPKLHQPPANKMQPARPIAAAQAAGAFVETPEEGNVSGAWRTALVACAALLVAFVQVDGAQAARSGGRMGGFGGGGMRAAPPRPQQQQQQQRQAQPGPGPRFSTGPNISIGVGPMFAPPMFGPPMGFGGFGLFGPPVLPVPVPSMGPSFNDQMLQDQQRRDERQIDSQKAQIDALQKELADLKGKRQ